MRITDITLRPIKLAFLVDYYDKEAFLAAVKINTYSIGRLTFNGIWNN
jgi:hypothetical protein